MTLRCRPDAEVSDDEHSDPARVLFRAVPGSIVHRSHGTSMGRICRVSDSTKVHASEIAWLCRVGHVAFAGSCAAARQGSA
jgi:hypothetical protein